MSLSIQAAHLNNEGIANLQSGNYLRSIELLGTSIKLMQKEMSQHAATNCEKVQTSSSFNDFLAVELPLQEQTNQEDIFPFNQAFQVPEHEVDSIPIRDIHTMSAVIIFNTSIAHHFQNIHNQQTKHEQKKQHQCLVESLYIMTLKLLTNQSCHNNRTTLIIKLACVNNLSIIGSDRCYKAATQALQTLSSHVSSGMDTDHNKNGEIFEESKLQRLLMNVLLLKAPEVAPAA